MKHNFIINVNNGKTSPEILNNKLSVGGVFGIFDFTHQEGHKTFLFSSFSDGHKSKKNWDQINLGI